MCLKWSRFGRPRLRFDGIYCFKEVFFSSTLHPQPSTLNPQSSTLTRSSTPKPGIRDSKHETPLSHSLFLPHTLACTPPEPETRNPNPLTRNPKPETRNPKPEPRQSKPGHLKQVVYRRGVYQGKGLWEANDPLGGYLPNPPTPRHVTCAPSPEPCSTETRNTKPYTPNPKHELCEIACVGGEGDQSRVGLGFRV